MKPRGLYELLLTKALSELLAQLPHNLEPVSEPLRSAEAADRLALHVGRAVQKALEDVPDAERVKLGVELVGRLLQQIDANNPEMTNSTEGAALDVLRDLGAHVRVSYDISGTRLHAKSWLFHRESGFSTAYIGSSNLTHSALFPG